MDFLHHIQIALRPTKSPGDSAPGGQGFTLNLLTASHSTFDLVFLYTLRGYSLPLFWRPVILFVASDNCIPGRGKVGQDMIVTVMPQNGITIIDF
jgi:hypothetical protein